MCWRRRSCRTPSSTASPPLTNRSSDSLQLTLYHRRPCRICPTLAFLLHAFIYVVFAIYQQSQWLAATHASPSTTLPHTSNTGVPANTWYNGNLTDIFIAIVSAVTQCNLSTHLNSCPFYGIRAACRDTTSPPDSLPAHGASAKNCFYYMMSPPINSAASGSLADSALMTTPSPIERFYSLPRRTHRH